MENIEFLKLVNGIDEEYIDSATKDLEQYRGAVKSDFFHVTYTDAPIWKQIAAVIVCTFAVLAGTAALMMTVGRTSEPYNSVPDDSKAESSQPVTPGFSKIDYKTVAVPKKGSYSEYYNPIEYYTREELGDIILSAGYGISDNFTYNVPKSIGHVSTFTKCYMEADKLSDYYRTYLETYKYLFPTDEFDDNNLFYIGANSYASSGTDNVKTIGKNFDEFSNENKDDVYMMFYSPYYYEGQPLSSDKRNHFMDMSSPIGSALSSFNKGYLAQYTADLNGEPNNKYLEIYTEPLYFSKSDNESHIGFLKKQYPINSTERNTLLCGKEMSVSDAVKFFEDYVNTMPYPENPNLDIKVIGVAAEEIESGKFCYSFELTKSFEGVLFDRVPSCLEVSGIIGNKPHSSEQDLSTGYMSVADDVDAAYNICRKVDIENRQDYTEIIPFDKALIACKESISENKDIELYSAEFVYFTSNGKEAEKPYQLSSYEVTPNYKFTFYNLNDNSGCCVYINAVTGELTTSYDVKVLE